MEGTRNILVLLASLRACLPSQPLAEAKNCEELGPEAQLLALLWHSHSLWQRKAAKPLQCMDDALSGGQGCQLQVKEGVIKMSIFIPCSFKLNSIFSGPSTYSSFFRLLTSPQKHTVNVFKQPSGGKQLCL